MLLKSRASLTCFRACLLPGRTKDLSTPRYDVTVEVCLMRNSHFMWFLVTHLRGRIATEARNETRNSGYYEMPTIVCNCVGPQEENRLSCTKARRLSWGNTGLSIKYNLYFESWEIQDTNFVDKDFSSPIFWGQSTIWIYTYDPISVTTEQPVIRWTLVECGDSPPFPNSRTVRPQRSIKLCSILRHPSNQSFSLKAQQTAQRVLKMDRSRPSSGTQLTHYHKLNVSYDLCGTAFIFQLRFWYARSWTQQGTYNCISRKYRVIKKSLYTWRLQYSYQILIDDFKMANTIYVGNVLTNYVVTNLMHKFLFYNKFIICLYMFRALCAHHQALKIVLYSIWYHHTCRWPSGAQERPPTVVMIPDTTLRMWTVLYWTQSSRTHFGVSINVWRLAGDTLHITCKLSVL